MTNRYVEASLKAMIERHQGPRPFGYVTLIQSPLKMALHMLWTTLMENGIKAHFEEMDNDEVRVSVCAPNIVPAIRYAKENLVESLWADLGVDPNGR